MVDPKDGTESIVMIKSGVRVDDISDDVEGRVKVDDISDDVEDGVEDGSEVGNR